MSQIFYSNSIAYVMIVSLRDEEDDGGISNMSITWDDLILCYYCWLHTHVESRWKHKGRKHAT